MNAFFGFERGWQAHRPECWLQRDSKCKSKTQQKVSKFPWHKTKVLSYNFGGKSSWLNYAMSWQQCVITSEEIHFKPFLLSLLLTECYKQWKPFSGRLRKEERRNQTFPFLSKLLSPVLNRAPSHGFVSRNYLHASILKHMLQDYANAEVPF